MKKLNFDKSTHLLFSKKRSTKTVLTAMLMIVCCFCFTNSAFGATYSEKVSKVTKTTKTTKARSKMRISDYIPAVKDSDDVNDSDSGQIKKDSKNDIDVNANIDKYTQAKDTLINNILNNKQRVEADSSFLYRLAKDNDRLYYYDLYIKLALAKGYIVTSYADYLTKYKDTDAKVLILRHDIDIADDATRTMFEIEKRNHVKATYYFRWATFDKSLIDEIHNSGFEVGLHYETIATYCIKNNNYIVDDNDLNTCREILKQEIIEFKKRTGVDIQTIASHGNPVNKKIGISNNMLFKGQNYKDFGIIGETYDENILNNYVKSYICDADILKNYGFSYQANPIDSILRDDKVIEFLSHPNHWNYTNKQRDELMEQIPEYSRNNLLK